MQSTAIIIFGATGDLAQQKLFPALLEVGAELGPGLRVVAIGRRPYDTGQFIEYTRQSLASREVPAEKWEHLSGCLHYYQMDFSRAEEYPALASYLDGLGDCNRLFYLSVPPGSYGPILEAIYQSGLQQAEGGWRRIVVEKPFGHDLESAVELNEKICRLFSEDQVYRVDHYLAKETVQNLLAFRFANGIFESLWNAQHIDHIQVTVAEEEGIRNRGPYYDRSGAVRDLLQNHMLQLLALLTMEEPAAFTFDSLSDQKAELLSRLTFDPSQSIFAQYDGYRQEAGVDPASQTESFVVACLGVDTPRWAGVPMYLRTGKRLAKRISEISVQFRRPQQRLFEWTPPGSAANVLSFRLQPDEGISLRLGVKTPRQALQVQPVQMEFCYGSTFRTALPDAYERLFLDVLSGERILALREDGIEASWRLVDRLLADKATRPLLSYPAGSWGPGEADQLLEREGRQWLAHESEICNGITVQPIT